MSMSKKELNNQELAKLIVDDLDNAEKEQLSSELRQKEYANLAKSSSLKEQSWGLVMIASTTNVASPLTLRVIPYLSNKTEI